MKKKWHIFAIKVFNLLKEFNEFVSSANNKGEKIAGYGAAAKASTLLNSARVKQGHIKYIIDENPEKIGRFMPNLSIPIVNLESTLISDINHIFIFPWNISDEIKAKLKSKVSSNVKLWLAIPYLEEVN